MRLRLMTYNILNDANGRERPVAKVLMTLQPDVIVLQEVMSLRLVESLAEAMNMHSVFAKGNSKRHIALLSKLPIVSHGSYAPFPLRTCLLEAAVEYKLGHVVHIFGVHLQAHYWIGCELWRLWELGTILRRITDTDQRPSVIAGDFNAVAPCDVVHTHALPLSLKATLILQGGRVFRMAITKVLKSGYSDCYRLLHPRDAGFTLPTEDPHVRLDYIFADEAMKSYLCDCDVISDGSTIQAASDHYPLIADFEL